MKKRKLLTFAVALLAVSLLRAQGESCDTATPLSNVSSWCSEVGAYNNLGAVEDGPNAGCFPNAQDNLDVWFSFVAEATDVNVSISGATGQNNGGTLENVQFALYSGDCGTLTEIGCFSDALGDNGGQVFAGPLTIGETYYIQVSARQGNQGTFQICVNNFNAIPDPSSDCNTGVILCDKSPFTVERVFGVGQVPNELGGVSCATVACPLEESGSAWYKWTCDEAGSLTFTLTPLNPVDDLDFVVYELPNGLENCDGKIDLRCMASGEVVGAPFAEWEPCTGPTGLQIGDPDVGESCGCTPGDNNFVAQVEMVAGRSYALVVNNFSQSGSGFSVEFGGTGTFLGPEAEFRTNSPNDTLCLEESITFTDESSFPGGIASWEWDFGEDAAPASLDGEGPHSVDYSTPGIKNILLRVTTADGCVVTHIESVYVKCCEGDFQVGGDITDPFCPNDSTGAIAITVANDNPPYAFAWDTGADTDNIDALPTGDYTVTITDDFTCDTVITYTVEGPPDFDVDTLINMPRCDGGTDGQIQLLVEGATPPYQFSWQGGAFANDNTLSNLPVGDYPVTIRDANGCELDLVIPVRELVLQLDPTVTDTINPSCTGFSDGSILLSIANGLPPYQYNFNDGNGFVSANTISGLPAGTYVVDVLDANLCEGTFAFVLEDPPPLQNTFELNNISCFGAADGVLGAVVSGGVGSYGYQWSTGAGSPFIEELDEGAYTVTITDGNGCVLIADTSFTQPPPLSVEVADLQNLLCFGDSSGFVGLNGLGGTPPYEFSIDGLSFQIDPQFSGMNAGDYAFFIMDGNGCTATVEATLTQPPQLTVDAGLEVRIELGYDDQLLAFPNNPLVSYAWSPPDSMSCTDCPNPTVNPVNTTLYTVTVTDEDGCTATDSVFVRVLKNRPLYVPDAFSPNGDGRNDAFTVYAGPGVRRIQALKIFNRWGGMVFDGRDFAPNEPALGWDGTFRGEPSQIGVYAFYAEVLFVDGITVLVEGDLQLVR